MDPTKGYDDYYFSTIEEDEEIAYLKNISLNQIEEVDNHSSIEKHIHEVYKEYPSEIECQLGITIGFENNEDKNTELETTQVAPAVMTHKQVKNMENVDSGEQDDIIDLCDDEDDQQEIAPVVNLSGICIIENAKNVLKLFPKHRSRMQSILMFLNGKKETDIVNPHVQTTNGYQLRMKDLIELLTPETWLNDVIIQNYISLLVSNYEKTLEIDTDILISFRRNMDTAVNNWSYKNRLHDYNRIVIPINPNQNHWALLVVDIWEGIIHSFDSFNKTHMKEMLTVVEFLIVAIKHPQIKLKADKRTMPIHWKYIIKDSPIQKNFSDCGVFTCTNARYFLSSKHSTFGQRDVKLLRQRIAYELITNRIIPFND